MKVSEVTRHPLLRWPLILGAMALLLIAAFSLYSRLLLDYSLESLELTASATNQSVEEFSDLNQKVYRNLIQDLTLEEIAAESVDLESLAMLGLATRSLNEVGNRAGTQRAKFYVNRLVKTKAPKRHPVLRFLDKVWHSTNRTLNSVHSFFGYIFRRVLRLESEDGTALGYSSQVFLTQARAKEKAMLWDDAIQIYRKFLRLFPDHSDYGLVSISLAQILLRQKDFVQAQKLLEKTQNRFAGSEQAEIAGKLLARALRLQERERLIEQLKKLIASKEDSPIKETLKLKLATIYLSNYEFGEAQRIFKELSSSENPKVRRKAKFYLGWTYKADSQFDRGMEVFKDLLQDPELEAEWELLLRAELADIYYQKKDIQNALDQYQTLSQRAREKLEEEKTEGVRARKALWPTWIAMAEMELANIYHFDLKDEEAAERSLNAAQAALNESLDEIKLGMQEASKVDLRKLAFRALREKKIEKAYDLFTKHLEKHPKDAWGHSGIASVYVLTTNLLTAYQHAAAAYQIKADEYTASVLAYILALYEQYGNAIWLYQSATQLNPSYAPAKFNLSHLYLEIKEYEAALILMTELMQELQGKDENYVMSKTMNNMGYAMWWLGDVEGALAYFQSSLEMTPEFKMAGQNLDRMSVGQSPQMVDLKE